MSGAPPVGPAPGPDAPSLDKDPRRIAEMFDAIAHRYDRLNHLLSAGFDRRWRRVAVAALDAVVTKYRQRGKVVVLEGMNDATTQLHTRLSGGLGAGH